MNLKKIIKKIIGVTNIKRVRSVKGTLKYIETSILRPNPKLKIKSEEWNEYAVYEKPNKHVFFGYYDIQQFDKAEKRFLLTEIPCKAISSKDVAKLEWVDIETGAYHEIAETKAWCWQQGARLRWYPIDENFVLYNDVENDKYVTRKYDISHQKLVETYATALYDITPDAKIGLSLNYSRLQRLRPGYGYSVLPDYTLMEKVPESDGIYAVDLETGQVRIIVSIKKLVELTPGSKNEWNYINHISVSPNGQKFLFFHLWTPGIGMRWHNKMYVANIDGTELKCIEDEYITSHYCWKDGDEILATTVGFGNSESLYIHYDIKNGTKKVLESEHLKRDGHPSFMAKRVNFISDTYPQKGCMQYIFTGSVEGTYFDEICSLYSDPRMFGEKRCDLHPRISKSNNYISVDSTFYGGKRSIVIFKHNSDMA